LRNWMLTGTAFRKGCRIQIQVRGLPAGGFQKRHALLEKIAGW
jgi:hypothetical protein